MSICRHEKSERRLIAAGMIEWWANKHTSFSLNVARELLDQDAAIYGRDLKATASYRDAGSCGGGDMGR